MLKAVKRHGEQKTMPVSKPIHADRLNHDTRRASGNSAGEVGCRLKVESCQSGLRAEGAAEISQPRSGWAPVKIQWCPARDAGFPSSFQDGLRFDLLPGTLCRADLRLSLLEGDNL